MGEREYLVSTHTGIAVFRKTFWFFGRRVGLRFDCPYCKKRDLKHWNLANHMEKRHNTTWAEADAQIRQAEQEWRQMNPDVQEE